MDVSVRKTTTAELQGNLHGWSQCGIGMSATHSHGAGEPAASSWPTGKSGWRPRWAGGASPPHRHLQLVSSADRSHTLWWSGDQAREREMHLLWASELAGASQRFELQLNHKCALECVCSSMTQDFSTVCKLCEWAKYLEQLADNEMWHLTRKKTITARAQLESDWLNYEATLQK